MDAIVLDTSAIVAIVKQEPSGTACWAVLRQTQRIFISAGTLTELRIVVRRQGLHLDTEEMLESMPVVVIPVDEAMSRKVADTYDRWGRGIHPAALNMGDCYAYALAQDMGLPLLYVGDDFTQTDVRPAVIAA